MSTPSLPLELWLEIFSHLPYSDLCSFLLVCKRFYSILHPAFVDLDHHEKGQNTAMDFQLFRDSLEEKYQKPSETKGISYELHPFLWKTLGFGLLPHELRRYDGRREDDGTFDPALITSTYPAPTHHPPTVQEDGSERPYNYDETFFPTIYTRFSNIDGFRELVEVLLPYVQHPNSRIATENAISPALRWTHNTKQYLYHPDDREESTSRHVINAKEGGGRGGITVYDFLKDHLHSTLSLWQRRLKGQKGVDKPRLFREFSDTMDKAEKLFPNEHRDQKMKELEDTETAETKKEWKEKQLMNIYWRVRCFNSSDLESIDGHVGCRICAGLDAI